MKKLIAGQPIEILCHNSNDNINIWQKGTFISYCGATDIDYRIECTLESGQHLQGITAAHPDCVRAIIKAIKPNTTISARSIGDYECIFTAKVLDRKGDFVTLNVRGEVIRKKVKTDYEGNEYVMALGTYSMAPQFR